MRNKQGPLTIKQARAQQLKIIANISGPDSSALYFNIITRRNGGSCTCLICRHVIKGTKSLKCAESRRFRLRHLDLKHPEIMEKIEKEKLEELAKKIVQENSTIP
jgi:hypothetical protein